MRSSICLTGFLSPSLSLENDDVRYMHYLFSPFHHLSRSLHLVPHRIQSRLNLKVLHLAKSEIEQSFRGLVLTLFRASVFGGKLLCGSSSLQRKKNNMSFNKIENAKQRSTLVLCFLYLLLLSVATFFQVLIQALGVKLQQNGPRCGCDTQICAQAQSESQRSAGKESTLKGLWRCSLARAFRLEAILNSLKRKYFQH